MIITLESTPTISIVNDQPRRLWRGQTMGGAPIVALVSAIGVSETADAAELANFERELIDSTKQILAQGEIVALPLEMAAGALLEGGLRTRLAAIMAEAFAVDQPTAPMDALLDALERELDRQRIQIDALRAALLHADADAAPSGRSRERLARILGAAFELDAGEAPIGALLAERHPLEARTLIAAACGVEPGEAITAAPIAVESAARDVVYAWQKWANLGAAGNVDPDALPRALAALAAALGDAP
jgi:hypothetical protein